MPANIQDTLARWSQDPYFDEATRREAGELTDADEIRDRFGSRLEFGTAGLRGVMAAGTNRMNRYTVRHATRALCERLLTRGADFCARGIVVAYDSRHNSTEYAFETALTACAAGIPAYVFPRLAPTPMLSFAVRSMHAAAGVVITASHNTKEYNGYKVYDETGCQILPDEAEKIEEIMGRLDLESIVPMPEEQARGEGLLRNVPSEVEKAFLDACVACAGHAIPFSAKNSLGIVYTPLHGAGNLPVRALLEMQGYRNLTVVSEQEYPDGDFPTVSAPNPENDSAMQLGIRTAARYDADIVLATDPDSDRIAVAVRHNGMYTRLSGNELGAVLATYLTGGSAGVSGKTPVLIKTIVTGSLGAEIARRRGAEIIEVPTGFKYIGREITRLEQDPAHSYMLGYEESCGFLAGTHVRDKDGVSTALLICDAAAYYAMQGMSMIDLLNSLYPIYGYYLNTVDTLLLPAADAARCGGNIMIRLRETGAALSPDVHRVLDYKRGIGNIPPVDMLKYIYDDGWVAVRPSGTEPKIKVYYEARQSSRTAAEKVIAERREALHARIADLLP